MLAPVALFVYNRPAHTRQTVEALQKNELSADSDLIIYSDASRTPDAAGAVDEVRQYIRGISGFKSVTIIERETNFGLARSIIDGVTSLCEKYGRVIVLEDDLVTSPHFLRFMNDALDVYEHEDKVMHVSGAIYPIGFMNEETFFFRIPLCWGWGTWDRAWQHFRKSNDVMLQFNRKMRREFDINDTFTAWQQLVGNKKGLINTWFVYWYAALFLRGGMALFPGRSLVRNIGMDGSGVHCDSSNDYDVKLSATDILVTPLPPDESTEAVRLHENYFRRIYADAAPGLYIRVIRKAGRIIRKMLGAMSIVRRNNK